MTGPGRIFFVFMLILIVFCYSAGAEEITADFLMTGETEAPVSITVSSPVYKTISRFGDERKESLNRFLKHISLSVNIDGDLSETTVMIDGDPVYSYIETADDSVRKTVYSVRPETVFTRQEKDPEDDSAVLSFVNDNFFRMNRLLDDLYPAFEKSAGLFKDYAKESSVSLNFTGYGKAVRRVTISLPEQYISDHFPAAFADLIVSSECREFIGRCVFKGPQKINLLYDQEDRLLRINYDGRAGLSEESLRKVSVVWRCVRSEEHRKDHLTLKTPSVSGNDRYNLIYERELDTGSPDQHIIKWDMQVDLKEGQIKKKTAFKGDLSFEDMIMKGEVSYSEKTDGKETKVIVTPSLQKENGSEFRGTIEIANYSGKIVISRTEYTVQFSPGKALSMPVIIDTGENEDGGTGFVREDGQIQELLSGILVRKLLSLPAEDLVFFNSDIPEETWKTLVQSLF